MSLNIKKMRFLNQDDSSRSKLISGLSNDEQQVNGDDSAHALIKAADFQRVKHSPIDILARLFPNQKRNVMELVLQGNN